jgi:hypothetical protein
MIDLDKLLALDKPETANKMLDYLFARIDDQLFTENHDPIHAFLKEIELDKISIQLGVGILSITKPLGRCDSRVLFSSRFRKKITKTEPRERVERLLSGLEEKLWTTEEIILTQPMTAPTRLHFDFVYENKESEE